MRLIIATQNKGKLKEIRHILRNVDIPVISMADLDRKFKIREDGVTFLENAIRKTKPVSAAYKHDLVAGEDSGLEVEFLGGRPGVRSRRYSAPRACDSKNNQKLLNALAGVDWRRRQADFRCVLVIMRGGRLLKSFQGVLRGRIASSCRGKGGFGYDPVFYLPQYKKTVAQLPLPLKNKISHRARALSKLKNYLRLGKYLTICKI